MNEKWISSNYEYSVLRTVFRSKYKYCKMHRQQQSFKW